MTRRAWLVAASAAVTFLVTGVVAAASLGPVASSHSPGTGGLAAQPDVECDAPNDPNCSVGDHEEEEGGDPPPSTGGDPDGDGACTWTRSTSVLVSLAAPDTETIEIPCVHPVHGWFDGDHCYWSSEFPWSWPPPDEPPEGQAEEDGQWYYGTCFSDAYYFNGTLVLVSQTGLFWDWFENADVPVVTPNQVALDWLAGFDLFGVEIQLAPPETGAGLIDLPVWLGVNETENTWGQIGRSHCIDDVCVTIEALVTEVEWDMGDGTVLTCGRDEHVVWEPTMNFLAPRGCHHYYRQASRDQPGGRYQITATSHWAVHWEAEASDAEDDIDTERTSQASLQVDEIQVLVGDE